MEHRPTPAKNWTTAVTFMFFLLAFLAINLMLTAKFLLTVTMGGIFALLLYPIYQFLLRHRWRPRPASFFLTLATALTLIVPMVWFVLNAIKQGAALAQSIASDGSLSVKEAINHLTQLDLFQRMGVGEAEITTNIHAGAAALAGAAFAILQTIPQFAMHMVLALLTCMFLLRDGKSFIAWFEDKIPLDPDARKNLFKTFRETAISTIWASLVASAAEALVIFTAFIFLGVPAPFLAGAFSFILSWIPIVGTSPIWASGAIYLFTQNHLTLAIVLVVIGLSGGIMNNFIKAMVIQGRNSLHPMVSLVTIIGGIGMFGLLGVFFGPILAAVLLALLDAWPTVGRRFGMLTHRTPRLPVTPTRTRPGKIAPDIQ